MQYNAPSHRSNLVQDFLHGNGMKRYYLQSTWDLKSNETFSWKINNSQKKEKVNLSK